MRDKSEEKNPIQHALDDYARDFELTQEESREAERRLLEYKKHPYKCSTVDEVVARLIARE